MAKKNNKPQPETPAEEVVPTPEVGTAPEETGEAPAVDDSVEEDSFDDSPAPQEETPETEEAEESSDDSVEEDAAPEVEPEAPKKAARGVLVLDRNVNHNGKDFPKGMEAKDLPEGVRKVFEEKGFLSLE